MQLHLIVVQLFLTSILMSLRKKTFGPPDSLRKENFFFKRNLNFRVSELFRILFCITDCVNSFCYRGSTWYLTNFPFSCKDVLWNLKPEIIRAVKEVLKSRREWGQLLLPSTSIIPYCIWAFWGIVIGSVLFSSALLTFF